MKNNQKTCDLENDKIENNQDAELEDVIPEFSDEYLNELETYFKDNIQFDEVENLSSY